MSRQSIYNYKYITTAGLLAWLTCVSSAGSALAGQAHPLTYETPRSQGMGGAFVAVADDQQALFSNPAGLSQITDKSYAVLDATAEINQDMRRVENKADGLSDADTSEARAANNRVLSEIMGQQSRLVASNLAYYLGSTGFGTGFLYQTIAQVGVERPTNPRIRAKADVDSVLVGAIARPIGNRVVFGDAATGHWGLGMKFISRRTLDREYDARDFATLSEDDLRNDSLKGAALDIDGGVLYKLANPWNQTVGFSVSNVFESEIDARIGRLPRRVDVGTAIRPLSGSPERSRKLLLAADLADITSDGTLFSKLRLGMEARMRTWLTLRGGLRGGYLSAGATAKFREARFEFATYSEELGERPGDREDRRYSVSMAVDF